MSDNVCANNGMHLNCETDFKKEKHRRTVYNLYEGGSGYRTTRNIWRLVRPTVFTVCFVVLVAHYVAHYANFV